MDPIAKEPRKYENYAKIMISSWSFKVLYHVLLRKLEYVEKLQIDMSKSE